MKKRLGALLLAAAILCGLSACVNGGPGTSSPDPAEADHHTMHVDVAVVGAGGAGMTAAVTAARAGRQVVILEKTAAAGGNSLRCGGGLNAAKTSWQDDNGWIEGDKLEKALASIEEAQPQLTDLTSVVQKEYDAWTEGGDEDYFDSVGLFLLDTMAAGKGANDRELASVLVENSANAVDWLESIGAPLHAVTFQGRATVRRSHHPVNEEGRIVSVGPYLIPLLEQACIDNGVNILFNTPATQLLTEEGNVVGVQAGDLTVNAKSVILATGGFGADMDMVLQQDPSLEGFLSTAAPGTVGDGIRMAQAVGAATVDMAEIQVLPTVESDTASPFPLRLLDSGGILINAGGLRFCDETGDPGEVAAAELAQTGGYAWLVLDQRAAEASGVMEDLLTGEKVLQRNTLKGLASVMEVPDDAFAETVETWNTAVIGRKDKEFGRTGFAGILDTAPFFAVRVAPGVYHTLGGLKIDSSAQVLDAQGSAIPGLFAAGEVTGGVHGAGCLDGNAVTEFVVFGAVAGESAAAWGE